MITEPTSTSIAPDGAAYSIPSHIELTREFDAVRDRIEAHRMRGGKVVAVQGLGFVGSAVAAVVASARNSDGRPTYFVVGTDLATPQSYWKVARINSGEVPIPSPDTQLTEFIANGVRSVGNLVATTFEEAYSLADVIVVDLPLDVADRFTDSVDDIDVRLAPFESALSSIGHHMKPDALVLIETTVPIGICERFALPLLQRIRTERGIDAPVLLAHAYERVMPGPRYVDSIKRFWRTFSGVDKASAKAARAFLSSFIDVHSFPLSELHDTNASEMAKLLENSYRAVNIAFMYEWTLLAERIGVNLFEVVNSIRVRKGTHDNMRFPGFGVGGYCLTKDSLLAQWSATTLFQTDIELTMTLDALRINHQMPLHTLNLAEWLEGGALTGKRLAIAGVSYLAEVADTRNSPTEVLVDELERKGYEFTVTDPYLARWEERLHIPVSMSLEYVLGEAEGLIVAVPHAIYQNLTAAQICERAPNLRFVVDAFDVISDVTAAELHKRGIRVAGVGKGHWRKLGYQTQ